MDNGKLSEIVAGIGVKYGYENTSAEFSPFVNLKVKWVRSYKSIDLQVSDYLQSAPESVVIDLIDTVFKKIGGQVCDFGAEFSDYVKDPEFSAAHIKTYLERTKMDKKVIAESDGITFIEDSTIDAPSNTQSVLMRVVAIKPEYAQDEDIRYVATQAIKNQLAAWPAVVA